MSLKQMQILDSTETVKQERPAPCARHCEANAFEIVIKNLKAQLAQPEQEPVACKHEWFRTGAMEPGQCRCIKCGAWNTTPPQRTEQCNYPDCKCPTENPCLKGLAQPEQEPVAMVESVATVVSESGNQEVTMSWWHEPALPVGTKLYTLPPQRKPLTHEQRFDVLTKFEPHKHEWHAPAILIDLVEAAHGIKENT